MDFPVGTFKCVACGKIWDGSELGFEFHNYIRHYICGDISCEANVCKIDDRPKEEYLKSEQAKQTQK